MSVNISRDFSTQIVGEQRPFDESGSIRFEQGRHSRILVDLRRIGKPGQQPGARDTPADIGKRWPRLLGHAGKGDYVMPAAVPAEHVDFMRNCTLSHCEDDYVFVHAGVRPGRPLAMQQRNDLLWIREDFLRATSPLPGKVVVHGHTICDVPQDLGYRIDIDTGAFVSGRLTCLILRNQSRRFLATGGP